jgi:hypothetical protein
MNKIGFKMSYELKAEKKRIRKVQVEDEMPMIIPGTAMAHTLDIMMKIQEFEDFFITAGFARLSKAKKRQALDSYRFLLTTLALIQPPSSTGVNEVAAMSSLGFMG